MRRRVVKIGANRNYSVWVESRMAAIVMLFYMEHVDSVCHSGDLENVLCIVKEVLVLAQKFLIALEINSVHLHFINIGDELSVC